MKYKTLTEALLGAPSNRPFITVWRNEDDVVSATFGQFVQDARARAAVFVEQGLRCGDTVILIMPQDLPLMASFAAAMLVGAVPSILAYPNFKVDPAKYRAGLTGVSTNLNARLIVVDEQFPDDLLGHVITEGSAKIIRNSSPAEPYASWHFPADIADPESTAFIQHSAGTTGLQKGVALSHAAVLRQLEHLGSALRLSEADRIHSWLPLYHDMGLIACFMLPLVYHLPVVMQSPTSWVMQPGSMLSLISKYRCTLGWIPNFALQFLARRVPSLEWSALDLSALRSLINCSEPIRAQSVDEFCTAYARHGLRPEALQTSYAMAENVFAVTQSMAPENVPCRVWVDKRSLAEQHVAVPVGPGSSAICLISSGRCLTGNRFKIVDAEGGDLSDGHVGEIVITSDSLFGGYHNRPDLTAKALKDGWYWSGDLGFCLHEQLYVIGRKNDLIIVAGKNIYPQDIEEIVCSHPRIHDGRAVAFGLMSSTLGTQEIFVVAEVTDEREIRDAPAIEGTIRNMVVAELGVTIRKVYIRTPKWIVKSTAGKPARSATREKLLSEEPELRLIETE